MISLSELKRAWKDGRSESEGDRRKGIWLEPFNPLVIHDSLARTLEDDFLPIILQIVSKLLAPVKSTITRFKSFSYKLFI